MNNKTLNYYAKKINEINNDVNDDNDEGKYYINDEKNIIVGEQPKKFYYCYDGDQYYFTAANAKFSIDKLGKITWYYGQWIDGFFRNGTWIDGIWHNGTFCRGNWLDGTWQNGQWYKGQINGSDSEVHP